MLESGHFLFNTLLWQIVYAATPLHGTDGAALFLGMQLSIVIDLDHSIFPQVGRMNLPEQPQMAPIAAAGDPFFLSTEQALSQQYHLLHYYRVLVALPFLLLALALRQGELFGALPFWESDHGAAISAGCFLGILWHMLGDSIAYWCGYTQTYVGISNVLMCAVAAQRFETLGIRLFARAAWPAAKRKGANFLALLAFCAAVIVLYLALESAVDTRSGEDAWRKSNLAIMLPALAVSLAFTALTYRRLVATLPPRKGSGGTGGSEALLDQVQSVELTEA